MRVAAGRPRAGAIRWIALLTVLLSGAGIGARPRHADYTEVRSVILGHPDSLPIDLATRNESQREAKWLDWIADHDRAIRARLAQGDEDTIINWMLFGTSFTSLPAAVTDETAADPAAESRRVAVVMQARAQELVRALAAPTTDERLLFARRVLEGRNVTFDSDAGRSAALRYLTEGVARVASEQAGIDRELTAARNAGDPSVQAEINARVFRTRGLSLDTSLAPNYALDRALEAMQSAGFLRPGAVKRIAIIGPGLDFSDKDSGFDFYPQQTLQPFAVIDSARRLQLGANAGDVEVLVFDISPRVIDHVTRAGARAARDDGYTLYLPLARAREWTPAFRAHWEHFGDRIGMRLPAETSKSVAEIAEVRAIRVVPQVVQRVSASDLNIVTDRIDGEGFDLVVATNVFVYYDMFDKLLALSNIHAMLRSGGFLLSNNVMPETETSALKLAGSVQSQVWLRQPSGDAAPTVFGDRVYWYQRQD
jgi:CheR methyltransferase, SAM binding domain